MSYCPRCTSPVPPGAESCPSCRTPLLAFVPNAAPAVATPRYAPAAIGRFQEPWLVLLLSFVTLGTYNLFWVWRITKETDAFAGPGLRSNAMASKAIWIGLVGFSLMVLGLAGMFGTFLEAATLGPDVAPDGIPGGIGQIVASVFAIMGGALVMLVAGILAYIAQWRVWSFVQQDEMRRQAPNQLYPGLVLAFLLVPYVNIVTSWIAMYMVQDHLNGVWAAAGGRPSPQSF